MHLQILASGSRGNCALIRAGELCLLVDAGLTLRECRRRLELARLPLRRLDHLVVTHGHLDHARSAGALARESGARLHCCEPLMDNASVRRAPRMSVLPVGRPLRLEAERGSDAIELLAVKLPHDADPTVALRIEHDGRRAVILTDMGAPDAAVGRALAGAHVLVLEFNHDREMLRTGPYDAALKRRVASPLGHLSNEQAREMLLRLVGAATHTLVLAHLSRFNNTPALASAAAHQALLELSRSDVRVLVAEQDEPGPDLDV